MADQAVNATANATASGNATTYGFQRIEENPMLLLTTALIIFSACGAVCVAGARVKHRLLEMLSFKRVVPAAFVGTDEAMKFPFIASISLFGLYVAFKYIPAEYVSLAISCYLTLFAVGATALVTRPVLGANVVSGLICVGLGAAYLATKHWVLLNILALSLCVTAIEAVPLKEFKTSALLLIGLFFYDIFWVFGTDVMLTVATKLDGPIKIMYPQNLFGDHEKKSLLGLGDIVIPGLFAIQMLRFSLYTSKGKSTSYFAAAMISYFLSLVNAMVVMFYFNHGQPALLYIVPWMLISCTGLAVLKGDLMKLFKYDEEVYHKALDTEAEKKVPEMHAEAIAYQKSQDSRGTVSALAEMALSVFGFGEGCARWRNNNQKAGAKKTKAE